SYSFTPAGSVIVQSGTIDSNTLQYQSSPHHAIIAFTLDSKKIIYLQLGFDKKVNLDLHGRCVSRIKNYVIADPDTGAGYYPDDFTEPGGDVGFSMVPIN
ncbi:MAG: hypothetical protein ACK47H_08900, partial [Akkermansiaceae bacterium]